MLNLDTNILIFLVNGDLTVREGELIERIDCGVSQIVLWEMSKLFNAGRIGIPLSHPILQELFHDVTFWPITLDVCDKLAHLDFRSDPADEIIAATSIAHGAPLLTRDRKLLASAVVPLAR